MRFHKSSNFRNGKKSLPARTAYPSVDQHVLTNPPRRNPDSCR